MMPCFLLVHDHLSSLSSKFDHYFPSACDPGCTMEGINDLFAHTFNKISVPTRKQNQLIDIANDSGLKIAFQKSLLPGFCIKANCHE